MVQSSSMYARGGDDAVHSRKINVCISSFRANKFNTYMVCTCSSRVETMEIAPQIRNRLMSTTEGTTGSSAFCLTLGVSDSEGVVDLICSVSCDRTAVYAGCSVRWEQYTLSWASVRRILSPSSEFLIPSSEKRTKSNRTAGRPQCEDMLDAGHIAPAKRISRAEVRSSSARPRHRQAGSFMHRYNDTLQAVRHADTNK